MKNLQNLSQHKLSSSRRMTLASARKKNQKPKTTPGAVDTRYPVILDGGRTIIYITDRSKENEIRERYAS